MATTTIPTLHRKPKGLLFLGAIPPTITGYKLEDVWTALPDRIKSHCDQEIDWSVEFLRLRCINFPAQAIRLDLDGSRYWPGATNHDHEPLSMPSFRRDRIHGTVGILGAEDNYRKFKRLRVSGKIPADVKFQLRIPTPISVAHASCKPELCDRVEGLYEMRLKERIEYLFRRIFANEDVIIHWELRLESYFYQQIDEDAIVNDIQDPAKPYWTPILPGIMDRLESLAAAVPADVQMAYQFCFGDNKDRHWINPGSCWPMVDIITRINDSIGQTHDIAWYYVPVPEGADLPYYVPLIHLNIGNSWLYLGLAKIGDMDATVEQILNAQSFLMRDFGIGIESPWKEIEGLDFKQVTEFLESITDPHDPPPPVVAGDDA